MERNKRRYKKLMKVIKDKTTRQTKRENNHNHFEIIKLRKVRAKLGRGEAELRHLQLEFDLDSRGLLTLEYGSSMSMCVGSSCAFVMRPKVIPLHFVPFPFQSSPVQSSPFHFIICASVVSRQSSRCIARSVCSSHTVSRRSCSNRFW